MNIKIEATCQNKEKIGRKGVIAVEDFVEESDFLVPVFEKFDKIPSWDGEIQIYKSKIHKKGHIDGRIPVQVKAKVVKSLSNKTSSVSIDLPDLQNYFRDGGVLLFLVEICNNENKIFISSLLPYDLHFELNNVKAGSNSKSIQVEEINDVIELEKLCREFLIHRKKQYSISNYGSNPLEHEYIELLVTSEIDRLRNEDIISRPHYIYGKIDLKCTAYESVKKMFVGVKDEIMESVTIKGKNFYKKAMRDIRKEKLVLTLGQGVNMTFENGKPMSFSICPNGSIADRINDYEFTINLIQENEFTLGTKTITLMTEGIEDQESKLNELEARLKYLNNVVAVLKYFNVDHNKLSYNTLDETDELSLRALINSIIFKKSLLKQKQIPGKYFVKIGNLNLLGLIYKKFDEDRIVIENYSAIKEGMYGIYPAGVDLRKTPEKVIHASAYVDLNEEEIKTADNIYPEDIYNDVIKYPHSEGYDTSVSYLCLRLIKVYDETKKLEYLENAEKILKWQEEGNFIQKHLIKLNKLQIIKRTRSLNISEIEYLIELKKNFTDDNFILCGIYLLLDDQRNFQQCFRKLNEKEEDEFKNFPIYNLIKDKL